MDTVRAWQILRGQTENPPTPLAGKWTLFVDEATGLLMIEADDGSTAPVGVGGGGGMSNPMTAPQDIIVGGTAGAPTRLGVGGAGQVLTVVGGVLTWAAPAGGGGAPTGPAGGDLSGTYPNPQIAAGVITDADVAAGNKDGATGVPSLRTIGTTATSAAAGNHAHAAYIPLAQIDAKGDILAGIANDAVGRVALVGALDGWVLTANAGASTGMGWATPAAPTAHATTHQPGGSDAMAVDAAAATGSLRTIGAGALAAAAGNHAHPTYVTNPMTTLGDLIAAGAAGAPARLGVGAADQVLAVVAGAPAWSAPAAVQNQLTNPGFENWSRGAGPFTASAAYGPDRWQLSQGAGSTMSVAQHASAANVDVGSTFCAQITYTHAAASRLIARLEDQYWQLRGRTVTLAVRIKVATASAVRVSVWDSVNGFRYSPYHTGGGAYETLTVTAPIAAAATGVQASIHLDASCTAFADNAVLVVGSSAPAYAPLHPADDLAQCQRYYYEVGGLVNYEFVCTGMCHSATLFAGVLRFPVEMAVTPTVTVSAPGDWAVYNAAGTVVPCATLSYSVQNRRSIGLTGSVASGLVAGNATEIFSNNTLAARIKFEANPP